MIRCDSKNKYQKDTCLKETEPRVQNVITVLGSTININSKTYMYDNSMSARIFTKRMNEVFIQALRFMWKVATALIWIKLVTILCR